MSYDIWLTIDTGGREHATVAEVGNYTSNVSPMWTRALGFPLADLHHKNAGGCIASLVEAVARFEDEPEEFSKLNPDNGWGDANGAANYLRRLLEACRKHPLARVEIWR